MSNQYDFSPYSAPPASFTWKARFVAFAIILSMLATMLTSCHEDDLPKSMDERLQGAWSRNWQGFEQTWFFDDGLCTAHSIIPAQPVQAYFWQYTCEGDTLTVSNLAASGLFRDEIRAVVEFPTDSTCTLGFVGGVNYFLKRI